MGIASYDVTGDGLPDVYLTSQGDNRLQTLAAGPSRPTYARHRRRSAASTPRSRSRATTERCRRPRGTPSSRTSTTTGCIDLFVSKGNVDAQPDYAHAGPEQPAARPAGRHVRGGRRRGRDRDFDRGRGAALVDFNLDGRLDLVESFYGAPVRVWRNDGPAANGGTAAATPTGSRSRLQQPAPNVDAIGAMVEVAPAGRRIRRELTVGGGHAGGQLGWIALRARRGRDRRRGAGTWPDGEVGPWRQSTSMGSWSWTARAGEVSGGSRRRTRTAS